MDTNMIMQFCAKCKNKRADQQQGLICGLTNAAPNFQGSCPDYVEDPVVAQAMAGAQGGGSGQNPDGSSSGGRNAGQGSVDTQKIQQQQEQMVKSSMKKMWIGVVASIVLSIGASIVFTYMYSSGSGMGGMNISFFPIVIGAVVGLSMSFIGGGKGIWAGIIGLLVTVASLLLSNVLMHISIVSATDNISFMEAFNKEGVGGALKGSFSNFSGRDYIYYGVAIVEGFGVSMGGSSLGRMRRHLPI